MGLSGIFSRKPKKGVREDLPAEVKRVVEVLRRVKGPEAGLNIVDEGLVYGITVEGKEADVFLLMARSTPKCHFCQMIAINVQRKILGDIIKVLREEGFNKIKVYNELGLLMEEG
ncbi:hypothetical protein APY94_01365 [Thermococcus celericrescens]|uniref:MIP18 family-like domain-containing protein n=1 Tax=Thermococcus celericrescens TaxID=227598 RepID=A0A100XZI6_9EURY|nr:iron-sulfur cluster assembly protein [Thermococcus celericrescens]KUH34497.1 hypothetical protein APY94_01365 [Thermococcus celericrescens]